VLFFHQPRTGFQPTAVADVVLSFPANARSLEVADLNEDGRVDLALARTRSEGIPPVGGAIQLIFQRPWGFPSSTDLVLAGATNNVHLDLLATDLNGDGEIDLASALQGPTGGDGLVNDSIPLFFSGK
jgi:hypothetical protein